MTDRPCGTLRSSTASGIAEGRCRHRPSLRHHIRHPTPHFEAGRSLLPAYNVGPPGESSANNQHPLELWAPPSASPSNHVTTPGLDDGTSSFRLPRGITLHSSTTVHVRSQHTTSLLVLLRTSARRSAVHALVAGAGAHHDAPAIGTRRRIGLVDKRLTHSAVLALGQRRRGRQ